MSFHSRAYLELNWKLAQHLNPSRRLTWLVIENTPGGSDDRVEARSGDFHVSDGYELDPGVWRPASFHHGIALNKALRLAKSRFVVILDPDFYIVRRDWIAQVVEHMVAEGLAFFGAPWHPRWYTKYRYFPCVHCMFIDQSQVRLDSLDFRPELHNVGSNKARVGDGQPVHRGPVLRTLKRWLPLGVKIVRSMRERKVIGSSHDTGSHIYRQYGQNGQYSSACVVPVYRPDSDKAVLATLDALLEARQDRLLERSLPDRLSYLPKRRGYYTRSGFRELGYIDASEYGWEEFMWQGAPFGFHIRGYVHKGRNREKEAARLVRVIASLGGANMA